MITLDKAGRSRVVTIIKTSSGTRQKSAKPHIGKKKITIVNKDLCAESHFMTGYKKSEFRVSCSSTGSVTTDTKNRRVFKPSHSFLTGFIILAGML